jgi:hypothetical protein
MDKKAVSPAQKTVGLLKERDFIHIIRTFMPYPNGLFCHFS